MKIRKITALLLALALCAGICAVTAEPALQAEGIVVPVIGDIKQFEIPDNDAMALLRDMKCGWNLGNTFDAHNGYTMYSAGTGMETIWTGAKTTRELITAVKEAGFNTIRIPVSWHNHTDRDNQIDAEWMNRVKQVAGWALDLGMYVIVNVHHDNDPAYLYPDTVHYDRSAAYLSAVWSQMAEAFRDCDEHLILESMNEPRLSGTQYEWNWNNSAAECRLAAKYINQLNQLFVDTVRASGGNNATRYLLVPAYAANPSNAADQAFQLPEDPADNRIIVEVHAYTPYNFALNTNSTDSTFDLDREVNKKSEIASFMNVLYGRFIRNGIPVLIDEFGAIDKGGNLQDRVNFTAWYVSSASARGITCVWWDNGAFSGPGERFGLINRKTAKWTYPEITEAILANCLYNRAPAEE